MERTLNYKVTAEYENLTLLSFLKSLKFSSSLITNLKQSEDGLRVNGIRATVRHTLHTGDDVTVLLKEEPDSGHIVPTLLPITIVYEDEDLMVLEKPSGMPIHPSQGNYENTLANAVAYHYEQKGESFTYRCINRLDRDTTGLLILAKHRYSAALLSDLVQKRLIHREYLAIATGNVPRSGVIEAPIGRVDGSTIERQVDFEKGEYSCTHYRRLAYRDGYSLVSLSLQTGRTHQIRVHMKHIGHPLPGDFLYNPVFDKIKRQALHSYRLSFPHPITGEHFEFTAPLPSDMKQFFPEL